MNGKTGNPRFGIDQRPPRPKSLRELYELVIKICPNALHNEEGFFCAVIIQLERDPIRNRSLKSDVIDQNLNLALPQSWPLNDFWYAADKYLRGLDVGEVEINKLWAIINDGFI